jgi:hypothetical protein
VDLGNGGDEKREDLVWTDTVKVDLETSKKEVIIA